jgi:hypothetical protein
MLPNGRASPIIFPLRAKLNLLFAQQRPKSQGGRRVVLLPVLPWVDGDRPPNVDYGNVKGVPTLNLNCWVGFGLSATGQKAVRLQDIKQAQLRPSFGGKFTPDVVHALKVLPATFFTISGQTKDSTGAILGSCHVDLFRTANDLLMEETTSNADGYYFFKSPLRSPNTYYVVAYKVGAPDVAGTTVNTLAGT